MKSRILISTIYGLLFLLAAFFGVLLSLAAQPGGISQSNVFLPLFSAPGARLYHLILTP
jgi:hypothetical protein